MSEPMPEQELQMRLQRIADYNRYQMAQGQPHHCLTEPELRRQLAKWGHDPQRAAGIGLQLKPSPILAALKAS